MWCHHGSRWSEGRRASLQQSTQRMWQAKTDPRHACERPRKIGFLISLARLCHVFAPSAAMTVPAPKLSRRGARTSSFVSVPMLLPFLLMAVLSPNATHFLLTMPLKKPTCDLGALSYMDCCCSPFCCPSDQNPFLWSHCGTYSGLGILDLSINKSQAHCPHVATLFSAATMCLSWSSTMWTVASIGSLSPNAPVTLRGSSLACPIQRCLPRRQRCWGTSGSHQRVDAETKPGWPRCSAEWPSKAHAIFELGAVAPMPPHNHGSWCFGPLPQGGSRGDSCEA